MYLQELFGDAVKKSDDEMYEQIGLACPLLEELSGNIAADCLRLDIHQSITRLQWNPESTLGFKKREESTQIQLDSVLTRLPKLKVLRLHIPTRYFGFGPFQTQSSTLEVLDVRPCCKAITVVPNASAHTYVCKVTCYGNGCFLARRSGQPTADSHGFSNDFPHDGTCTWYTSYSSLSGCGSDELKEIRMFSHFQGPQCTEIDFPRGCTFYAVGFCSDTEVEFAFSQERGLEGKCCEYVNYHNRHGFLGPREKHDIF